MKKENKVVQAIKNDYDKSMIKRIVGGGSKPPGHIRKLERTA